uniref:Uncharacterized protein n=1 Tax=Candidatus Kentrum sp. FM TaxID=2126340 RepID=A0A450T837_9GAMM|nr:MAG: hypothetical protein BECKFM1743C_GA0114222_102561 [Candidatus Kentron sp. FM]VFJ62796.1 MAG: hypothetical protein BECKFM1743A_GA0114220_103161 [Candidatus Kentron sp. FM]VFK13076.1 MAG: hypothetical protein BECKFM1743B_GA0114221_102656 [Candidatus Kentron sp. FM]
MLLPVQVFRNLLPLLAITVVFLLTSACTQLGPDFVKRGRNDYNQVIAQTDNEEALLNLVRLRYADNPVFLEVANITTSFTWDRSLQLEVDEFEPESTNDKFGIDGNIEYTERPTITYIPLGGADFVRNVLTPIDIDSLLLLSHSGWSIERLLRVMANRMNGVNNAQEASGPTPDKAPLFADFITAARTMRTLQEKGSITFGYRELGKKTVPAMRIESDALGSTELCTLVAILGLRPSQQILTLDVAARHPRPDAIGIELRSLAGIMFFLSHGVDVPERDLAAGRVTVTKNNDGDPFDWQLVVGDLLDIKSQDSPPVNAAVAIEYRGSWFYIDDSDLQSKYTFMLLGQLSALQAGNIKRAGPVLTMPVSSSQ